MKYSTILLIILTASCSLNGIGPTNDSVLKEIQTQPADSVFIGVWKLDSISYKLIKEEYNYNGEQVELTFSTDNSFELINVPDFIADGFGRPINGEFLNSKGKWEPVKSGNHWEMQMEFEPGDLFQARTITWFMIFERDSNLVLNYYIGDPDNGDRFLFYKD